MRTQKCHGRVIASLVGCTALVLGVTGTSAAQARSRDLGRQVLGAQDGWGAHGTGTTGGAAADAAHVYTVTDLGRASRPPSPPAAAHRRSSR